MFKEFKRTHFKDLLNNKIWRLRVGDSVRTERDERGIILERRSLEMVLAGLSTSEAKLLLSRISAQYENTKDYCVYVVQIKNLISTYEPHQIELDTSVD